METTAFIEAIRRDIASGLKQELLNELQPEIERRLYANIFDIKEAGIQSIRKHITKDGQRKRSSLFQAKR